MRLKENLSIADLLVMDFKLSIKLIEDRKITLLSAAVPLLALIGGCILMNHSVKCAASNAKVRFFFLLHWVRKTTYLGLNGILFGLFFFFSTVFQSTSSQRR